MTCEHLRSLEEALIAARIKVTFRGAAWTMNCREWVYFDCILDRESLRQRMSFDSCIKDHEHRGTHDGCEAGFYCSKCQDGVMGIHPDDGSNRKVFG